MEAEPRIRKTTELAQGGHDDGSIAARGFFRTVIGDHFRQHPARDGFVNFQREQSHNGRFSQCGERSKP